MTASRTGALVAGLLALAALPAHAQGVFVPTPGSAPTVVGPGTTNPSAAASGGMGATNPSAAASAISTPNALNPSGASSTFAPALSGGSDRVLSGRTAPGRGIVRQRRAKPPARAQRPRIERKRDAQRPRAERQGKAQRPPKAERRGAREAPAPRGGKAVLLPREKADRADARARRIVDGVCRGC